MGNAMKKNKIRSLLLLPLCLLLLALPVNAAEMRENTPRAKQQNNRWTPETQSGLHLQTWLFFSDGPAPDPFILNQSGVLPGEDVRLLYVLAGTIQSDPKEDLIAVFNINGINYFESTTLEDTDFFDGKIEILVGSEAGAFIYDEQLEKVAVADEQRKSYLGSLSFHDGKFTGDVKIFVRYLSEEQAAVHQKINQSGLYPTIPPGKYSAIRLSPVIEDIVRWKKEQMGIPSDRPLFDTAYLEQAGTPAVDWFAIGMARYKYEDDYEAYRALLKEYVEKKYRSPEKLDKYKATEWHRIALAVLACDGDPTDFGKDSTGAPINLIADGVYNRGQVRSLGAQGLNGWLWGLIALDSARYEVPQGAYYSRREIITHILEQQLPDGGFALYPEEGSTADPDVTAMAIQALAPYYHSATFDVKKPVDAALERLSAMQTPNGGFCSMYEIENIESTAQVLVALCSLGIDPQNDPRFIKNGYSVVDAVLTYRCEDGGFTHSFEIEKDNPSAVPGVSNSMSGEQALYSLVAVWRQMKGMSPLYDFKPGGVAAAVLMPPDPAVIGSTGAEETGALLYFAPSDKQTVDALPHPLSTEEYVPVVKLLDKLERSESFAEYDDYMARLKAAKAEIDAVQAEIDSINAEVFEKLYPFEELELSDKSEVDKIYARYQALSDYDQAKVLRWEDVIKTKTQVDNLMRAIYIAAIMTVAGSVITVVAVKNLRLRANRKRREMDELAAQYEETGE